MADNKINGLWSCENPDTLGDLRDHLNFSGFVVSDWGAARSTSIAAGLDMEKARADAQGQDVSLELMRNGMLAEELGFTGTPAWITGDTILQGAQGVDALAKAIAGEGDAR